MAIRLFSFILVGIGLALSADTYAQIEGGNDPLGDIIAPDLERREIKEARVDTENWEVGAFVGVMAIEDFGTGAVYGARVDYHITENLFAEFSVGQTEADETSFEVLSGGTQILTSDERDLTYFNVSVGYNLFQGELFLGENRAYNANLYILAGVGNTDFAGDDFFTLSGGVGTRLFFTDWLSLNADLRAYSFEHEILGPNQRILNWEPSVGVTIFF